MADLEFEELRSLEDSVRPYLEDRARTSRQTFRPPTHSYRSLFLLLLQVKAYILSLSSTKYDFKGTVSRELRPMLLYVHHLKALFKAYNCLA